MESSMEDSRLYWLDTYCFEAEAKVLSISTSDDGKNIVLVLDRTIFYPQGGGQPSDSGHIVSKDGSNADFCVEDVRAKDGKVLHVGHFATDATFEEGREVILKLDKDKRMRHARLHSGGHLLDVAVTNIGQTQLQPGKGYHFPGGAYVEYIGSIDNKVKDSLQKQLEAELARLIAEGSTVSVVMAEPDQVVELCGSFPDYLPKDKPARIVTLVGKQGCPCGGTHVKDVKDIGGVTIRKITSKGGKTRISYDIQ